MNLDVFEQFAKKEKGRIIGKSNTAVIYTRVSSKEQFDNNASLTTQLKYCQEYALKKELEVMEYFGGTYESAKSDERKEFQKMLDYVKRRKNIGYIIVYSYDRFSRTGANGAYISGQLKKQGVAVISATQEIDVTTSAGTFQENLYHMFSHFDNQIRRDKSITGMREKLRRGYWTGAYPFGYTNTNPGKGKIPNFVISEEGRLLKRAFLWKANANMSHVEIAARLKEKGLNIKAKKLTDLFRNPFYCGLMVNGLIPGEVIQGKHEALISKEVFLKIHNLLHAGDPPKKYSFDDENLPLKMFIRSSVCGTPYTGYVVKKKGLYYYKNRRKGSKENRSAKKLHEEFLNVLGRFAIADKKYIAPLTDIIHGTLIDKNQEALNDQKRSAKELDQLQERIDTLERRFVVLNEITKPQYDLFMPELKTEKRELEKKLGNGGINSSNLKKSIKIALDFACNLPLLWELGDLKTKRAIQYMVFPDGIGYDFKNKVVRTFRVNEIFGAICLFSRGSDDIKKGTSHAICRKSPLVTSTGFKPVPQFLMFIRVLRC
ncbi:DNA invertase Pin-like site-specific DNA recombinase [Mariniflexile fucanivorans]|uniref:DNA invertase Pin-like site-specific DNA recombinase n=1 Tax=Mariniflexile fucanivorans TaxID=264023 RepID=A0A4R1RA91_9FLAO|nr:recombinase family protein [Mariniflexile fucanivorans]TCL62663.1 DNA invertase Pin-like site-specific DNA recombinase [Mariniflexile fucanivorans]